MITKCPADTNSVGFSITGDGTVKHGWKEVTRYRACGPIVVDGHLDGPSWQKAPWTDLFGHLEEPAVVPFLATRARMLWDDEYFYIGADLEDLDVWGALTGRDSTICGSDTDCKPAASYPAS
jgi:hypothetical protein